MTVTDNKPVSGPHITDGVNTNFGFEFKITDQSHMRLQITDLNGLNRRTVTSGISVASIYINNDNGGYATYTEGGDPLPAGLLVYPFREVPYDQPNRIGNQGRFAPQVHEDTFDRLEMQVQQLREQSGRAITVEIGEIPEPGDVPSFDEDGNVILIRPSGLGNMFREIYDPSNRASDAFAWQGMKVSITDKRFGVSQLITQTPAVRTPLMQAAINLAAAAGFVLSIPIGELVVNDTLVFPSNLMIEGVDKYRSIIKMDGSVAKDIPVVVTGDVGVPKTNFSIANFTIDYNKSRWANAESGMGTALTGFKRCLAIVNSTKVYISNIYAKDAAGYGIDITSPAPTNAGPIVWNPEGSKYVWVSDCEVSGSGDDNFTTRHSSHVWFTRCLSRDTDRNGDGLANAFEFDDGSRNIFATDCVALRCEVGFQVKGHGVGTGAPAAYNVQIRGGQAINCCQGLMVRNAAFSVAATENTFDDYTDTTVEFSKTAIGLLVDGLFVIAPRRCKVAFTTDVGGIDLGNYTNITLANVTIDEGTADIGNKEYLPADTLETYVLAMSTLLRRVILDNLTINGFRTAEYGVRATSTVGGLDGRLLLFITNIIVRDGPKFPVFVTSATRDVYIDGYTINGRHTADGGCGITVGGTGSATRHSHVGEGRISGYQTAANVNGFTSASEFSSIVLPQYIADNNGALTVVDVAASIPVEDGRIKTMASGSRSGLAIRSNANSERVTSTYATPNGLAGKDATISDAFGTRMLRYMTATTWVTSGSGSPEGNIVAPIGCMWLRTDGGAGTTLYVKQTGAGNTGWAAK